MINDRWPHTNILLPHSKQTAVERDLRRVLHRSDQENSESTYLTIDS